MLELNSSMWQGLVNFHRSSKPCLPVLYTGAFAGGPGACWQDNLC